MTELRYTAPPVFNVGDRVLLLNTSSYYIHRSDPPYLVLPAGHTGTVQYVLDEETPACGIAWDGASTEEINNVFIAPLIPDLDPGIKVLVHLLNRFGWKTTDSGDGVYKPVEARSVEGPHVFMQTNIMQATEEFARMISAMHALGVSVPYEISISYSDGIAIMMLCGVCDKDCS